MVSLFAFPFVVGYGLTAVSYDEEVSSGDLDTRMAIEFGRNLLAIKDVIAVVSFLWPSVSNK
jgi:hypothetical protein